MTAEVCRYATFTDERLDPGHAGVVLDAGALTDVQMLAIARAVGYSETAFVLQAHPRAGNEPLDASVRFFTAAGEVPFCEHALVATAIALAERHGPGRLRLQTAVGPVPVTTRLERDELVATVSSEWTIRAIADGRLFLGPATESRPPAVMGRASRLTLSPYDDAEVW